MSFGDSLSNPGAVHASVVRGDNVEDPHFLSITDDQTVCVDIICESVGEVLSETCIPVVSEKRVQQVDSLSGSLCSLQHDSIEVVCTEVAAVLLGLTLVLPYASLVTLAELLARDAGLSDGEAVFVVDSEGALHVGVSVIHLGDPCEDGEVFSVLD